MPTLVILFNFGVDEYITLERSAYNKSAMSKFICYNVL